MSTTVEHKNMDDLVKNKEFLTARIYDLNYQLQKALSDNKENDTNIKKLEVSHLNKNELISKMSDMISLYAEDERAISNKGVEVNRLYADGTREYCRNISRGNWNNINGKLFDNCRPEWEHLFPSSILTNKDWFGYEIIEKYVSMTSSRASEVRKVMELLSDVYKFSKV
jgi:hypothetical protein